MARHDERPRRRWRFKLSEDTILEVSAPQGATEKQVRRRGRISLVLMTLAAAAILVGVAGGAVWTDQSDYSPGSVVTISGDNRDGAGYIAGETVLVNVSGPNGYTAACDGTADENGAWSCQITLWDNDLAIGAYTYIATGQTSGVSESGTFTDAQIKIFPAPSGVSFTLTWRGYTNSGCTSDEGSQGSASISNASGGHVIALSGAGSVLGAKTYVKFTAPASATAPSGATFANWSSSGANVITTTTNLSICVRVPTGGNNDAYTATYNLPATNHAPTVSTEAVDASGAEGSALSTNGAFSDQDGDALTISKQSGSGTVTPGVGGAWSWSYTPSDSAPNTDGSGTVVVQADDGHGGTATDTFNWSATNVAPTATFPSTRTVSEGTTGENFAFSAQYDPSSVDTSATFHYSFRCSSAGTLATTYATAGTTNSVNCSFPDGPATVSVTGRIFDKDNGYTDYTTTVTVNNVAPTTTLSSGNTLTWDESGSAEQRFDFSVSDPGDDTYSVTNGYPSCGTGGTYVASSLEVTGNSYSQTGYFKCKFPDGVAGGTTTTVSIGFTDSDGAAGTSPTQNVTVNNVAPSITAFTCPTDPIAVGASASFSGTFNDPGWNDATWTPNFTFGDGAGPGTASATNGSGTFIGSHVYSAAGIYTPSVTVTDKDNGQSTAWSCTGYIVVYDPSAGFVTGGGWIYSEAGYYRPDPSLAGKATFGFVSKYKKGATVPEGNTEFQFHVANLNFKSTSYQWLVVSGGKATYKGVGTINGSGNYGFLLSAIDGSPDKFRIKIWDKDNADRVVYDTLPAGSEDTADPSTALGGGSIVIHTGKK